MIRRCPLALLALSALLLAAAPARASIGLSASRWEPRDYETLRGFGLSLGLALPAGFSLEGRAGLYSADASFADLRVLPLQALLLWSPPVDSWCVPYFGGGVGFALKHVEANGSDEVRALLSAKENHSPVTSLLVGLRFPFGPLALAGELQYLWLPGEDDLVWPSAPDKTCPASLSGFLLSLSLSLSF